MCYRYVCYIQFSITRYDKLFCCRFLISCRHQVPKRSRNFGDKNKKKWIETQKSAYFAINNKILE